MILMCRLPLVQRFEEFVFTTSLRQFLCFSSKIGFNDQNPHRSSCCKPPKNANVISFMDGTREGRVDAMIRTDWLIALRPTEAQLQCFQGVLSPPVFSRVLNFLKSLLIVPG